MNYYDDSNQFLFYPEIGVFEYFKYSGKQFVVVLF